MDKSPHLTTDGLGNWIAVWASSEDVAGSSSDTDILFATSTDHGRSWSAPLPLNTNASNDSGADEMPRIETDRQGRWVVIWQSFENLGATTGTEGDILVSTSTNLGSTWSAPQPLNSNATTDSTPDSDPAIHYASNGHWVVGWTGSGSSGSGTDSDIFHSRSSDGGTTWSPLAPLNNNAASDEGSDSAVSLAADGQGNWVAIWSSTDDLAGVQDGDSDLLYSRSFDDGSSWTPPAFVRADAMSDRLEDFGPQLRTDRSGTWMVVWESGDDLGGTIGTDQNILVVRSTDNGLT